MKRDFTDIGTFTLESGVMRISDPCYKKDVWCTGIIPNCRTGRWEAVTAYYNDGLFGRRVSMLAARAVDSSASFDLLDELGDLAVGDFDVGVDSGQAGMYDDATYGLDSIAESLPTPPDKIYGTEPGSLWYSCCCEATDTEIRADVLPNGVVSRSGFGDGGYTAFYHIGQDKKVDLIAIQYIDEEMEDAQEEDNVDDEDLAIEAAVLLLLAGNDERTSCH